MFIKKPIIVKFKKKDGSIMKVKATKIIFKEDRDSKSEAENA